MKPVINMLSTADKVSGQGVGAAYLEQVGLVKDRLSDEFTVTINKKGSADITHFHTINPTYYLRSKFSRGKTKKVGYVHFLPETVEDSLSMPRFAKKVFYKYMLSFYRSMDHLVVVNPYFIERLAAYGVKEERITYIPNFVSEEQFFRVSPEKKAELREQYGIDKDAFVVLGVGQMQTRKGIFDFFDITEARPDITFVWAGGFSFGVITKGYEQIKQKLEDPPKNLVLPGIVPREKMNEVYNLADVMFLPSFEELFPMSVLESMNVRLPILLRDIELYKNILFDYYQKADSVSGFLDIIDNLNDDPIYYEKAADDSWRGHVFYSKDHVAAMWRQLYEKVLGVEPRKS